MRRPLLVLFVAAIAVLPSVAADSGGAALVSRRAWGFDGVAFDASNAQVFLAARLGQRPSLLVDAPHAVLDVYDLGGPAVAMPTSDTRAFTDYDVRHEAVPMTDASVSIRSVLDPRAVLLVRPIGAMALSGQHTGSYEGYMVEDDFFDRTHTSDNGTPNPDPAREYTLSSGPTLKLQMHGKTTIEASGYFQVYFWGFGLHALSDLVDRDIRTGFWSEPGQGGNNVMVDDHFIHAVLTVRGGTLALQTGGVAVGVYSNAIRVAPVGEVSLDGANGSVPSEDGRYTSTGGTVVLEGGRYSISRGDDALHLAVLQGPAAVHGDSVAFHPTPFHKATWFLVMAATLPALLGGSAYLYPTALGLHISRRLERITSQPAEGGWRAHRNLGYARLASRSEENGNPSRAAWWAGHAARLAPDDPESQLRLAIYQAQVGRLPKSLEAHAAAHEGFRLLGDFGNLAHNAYQAARTAARAGLGVAALDWLRIAFEADPGLAKDIGKEPAFAALRDAADYASLVGC